MTSSTQVTLIEQKNRGFARLNKVMLGSLFHDLQLGDGLRSPQAYEEQEQQCNGV